MRKMLSIFLACLSFTLNSEAAYDPLSIEKTTIEQKDFIVRDERRSRDIPIRVYFPASKSPAPLILFSHGLGVRVKIIPTSVITGQRVAMW